MAVLLFSSVLLHEFGHVLVALRQGAKVRSITLMMLGGISDIEEIPSKPGQEFRLAVMGPIVSLALAAIGFTLLWQTSQTINFAQGEFVMVPAFLALIAMRWLGLPFIASLVVAVLASMLLLGVAFRYVIVGPLIRRGSSCWLGYPNGDDPRHPASVA